MGIKILSVISLLPFLFIIKKVVKRMDLNVYDILLTLYTIYMCIIPILGNTEDIMYPNVKNNTEIHLYVFIVYNAFAYILLFLSLYQMKYKNKEISFFNTTYFIRYWINKYKPSNKCMLFTTILCVMLAYILFYNRYDTGLGSMDDIRDSIAEQKTSFSILLNCFGSFIRLYIVFLLYIIYFNRDIILINRINKIQFYFSIIFLIFFHIQATRTFMLESCCYFFLIYYANNKNEFTLIKLIKWIAGGMVIVALMFPIVSALRYGQKIFKLNSEENKVSIIDLTKTTVELFLEGDIDFSSIDNKDSRSWYIYQIIGHSYTCPYEGNGELLWNAFTYGIPSIIYSNKSKQGSQGIIEKKTGINTDVADSFLLCGIMENRFLGPVIAVIIFILVFICYIYVSRFTNHLFVHPLLEPYFLGCFIIPALRVELSWDYIILSIISIFITSIIIYMIVRHFKKIYSMNKYNSLIV